MCTTRVQPAFAYGTWAKNDAREGAQRGIAPSSPYVSHTDRHIYPADATTLNDLPGVVGGQAAIQFSLHDKYTQVH